MAQAIRTTNRDAVVLVLSLREARALAALAGEGAEGLLADPEAAKAYVGNAAAQDAARAALETLGAACKRRD